MPRTTACRIAAILMATLLSTTVVLAQGEQEPVSSTSVINVPIGPNKDWAQASAIASSRHKLIIVTLAEPTLRHTCRVQSFTPDQLVCKGSFGKTRTYNPQEIAALIIPGNKDLRLGVFLIFTGGGAAAMWGTLELAAACIPCAFATVAAAILITRHCMRHRDGIRPTPELLLYLMPSQTLQIKLH